MEHYPKPYINDTALAILLGGSKNRRYSWVKRALNKKTLIRLKRGVYLFGNKKASEIDTFEIALQLYGPSYISFESALSYHGWIPEAVYTTSSATPKRSSDVTTLIGRFSFEHIPKFQFFMGVEHIETYNSAFLMAHPWKALADYLYVRRKNWKTLTDAIEDLRLNESAVQSADKAVLEEISQYYHSPRVRQFARLAVNFLK